MRKPISTDALDRLKYGTLSISSSLKFAIDYNQTSSESVDLSDGLVAYYRFDENLYDSSGNDNHAEVDEEDDPAYYSGVINQALQSATIQTPGMIGGGDWSVSFWVNTDSASDGADGTALRLLIVDAGGASYEIISLVSDGALTTYKVFIYLSGGQSISHSIGLAHWHHVAVTSSGGTVKLYFDGEFVGSAATSFIASAHHVLMTTHLTTSTPVDELAVYGRELNAAEVAALSGEIDPTSDYDPINVSPPEISYSFDVEGNVTLTTTNGVWLNSDGFGYQWYRDEEELVGETFNEYDVQPEDIGHVFYVSVATVNDFGSSNSSSDEITIYDAPINSVPPAITGLTTIGSILSCSTGTWITYPVDDYDYQWKRDGSDIGEATSSGYTLTVDDLDAEISCVVSATNNGGISPQTSNSVGPITDPDAWTPAQLNPRTWIKSSGGLFDNSLLTPPALVDEDDIVAYADDFGTGGSGKFTATASPVVKLRPEINVHLTSDNNQFTDSNGTNFSGATSLTLFWAGHVDASSRNPFITIQNSDSYLIMEMNTYAGTDTNKIGLYFNGNTYESTATVPINGTPTVIVVRFNTINGNIQSNTEVWMNGGSAAALSVRLGEATASFNMATINTVQLGGPFKGVSYLCDTAEMGIITNELSYEQLDQLGEYLAEVVTGTWSNIVQPG